MKTRQVIIKATPDTLPVVYLVSSPALLVKSVISQSALQNLIADGALRLIHPDEIISTFDNGQNPAILHQRTISEYYEFRTRIDITSTVADMP